MDFESRLATSADPATRTRGTISAKDDAKVALITRARELTRIIQATPTLTNQQRIELGLNERGNEATPINPPTEAPVATVAMAIGRTLKLTVRAADSDRRGKPEGVAGATIFSLVGAEPTADVNQWQYEGQTTRTNFDVVFAPTVPAGSQVWVCAAWYNPRGQTGPLGTPISAYLAGGLAAAA